MFTKDLKNRGYDVLTLDISKLAASLAPFGKYEKEPFWIQSARIILEFFISYTLEALPEENHNMYTVSRLYRAFTKELGEAGFLPWLESHPDSFAKIRYDEINALKASEKTLDIGMLGEKKTVLFLNVSDVDHSMDPLVNIFYSQVLQTLIAKADCESGGQLRIPVRVIMDDFASSAIIPDFDKIISVVRSRDLWISLCIQSFTQLESLYTYEQAQTIVSNCDHIVYMGSNDLRSAQFIGTRANRTPESILVMDRTKEYILEGGKPAVLADKVPSYSYTAPAV